MPSPANRGGHLYGTGTGRGLPPRDRDGDTRALTRLLALAGLLATTRLLGTLLYRVSPTDPPTFLAGALVLGAAALAAAALPAIRAARLDPAVALRAE